MHSLSDRNKETRLQFCRHFQGIVTENPVLPNKFLVSDEAHFYLHYTVITRAVRKVSGRFEYLYIGREALMLLGSQSEETLLCNREVTLPWASQSTVRRR